MEGRYSQKTHYRTQMACHTEHQLTLMGKVLLTQAHAEIREKSHSYGGANPQDTSGSMQKDRERKKMTQSGFVC